MPDRAGAPRPSLARAVVAHPLVVVGGLLLLLVEALVVGRLLDALMSERTAGYVLSAVLVVSIRLLLGLFDRRHRST